MTDDSQKVWIIPILTLAKKKDDFDLFDGISDTGPQVENQRMFRIYDRVYPGRIKIIGNRGLAKKLKVADECIADSYATLHGILHSTESIVTIDGCHTREVVIRGGFVCGSKSLFY